ncbi:Uncharacterized protein AXF42_Ash008443 [Apostasia shenzhenica]|uniref:Mitochondrial glycoprotein n=1 Tax=Apostasia shenzhenica TaxID=1088818 RepID=A0A2I0AXW1_9ASPA|nr:Uncharacterized protein AXF42_Ash008443 [Apostasia shenzhenica]
MASSMANSLLRRVSRFPISFAVLAPRPTALSYSALASSLSSSALLLRRELKQSIWNPSPFLFLRFASTKLGSDENLMRVLQSEIDCVQESEEPSQEPDVPEGFPFEIIDTPGDQTIVLKREYAGEIIQATVYMNLDEEAIGEDNEDGDDDEDEDDDQKSKIQQSISLHITIDKGEGPILEFGCNLNSDELQIETMETKSRDDSDGQGAYQGPDFSDLDENLQKAFHKYLEVRGFQDSLHSFLHEYMMNKDEREYLTWLKNIKEFIMK